METTTPQTGVSKKVAVVMAGISGIVGADQFKTQIILAVVVLGFVFIQGILDKKAAKE